MASTTIAFHCYNRVRRLPLPSRIHTVPLNGSIFDEWLQSALLSSTPEGRRGLRLSLYSWQ